MMTKTQTCSDAMRKTLYHPDKVLIVSKIRCCIQIVNLKLVFVTG